MIVLNHDCTDVLHSTVHSQLAPTAHFLEEHEEVIGLEGASLSSPPPRSEAGATIHAHLVC